MHDNGTLVINPIWLTLVTSRMSKIVPVFNIYLRDKASHIKTMCPIVLLTLLFMQVLDAPCTVQNGMIHGFSLRKTPMLSFSPLGWGGGGVSGNGFSWNKNVIFSGCVTASFAVAHNEIVCETSDLNN